MRFAALLGLTLAASGCSVHLDSGPGFRCDPTRADRGCHTAESCVEGVCIACSPAAGVTVLDLDDDQPTRASALKLGVLHGQYSLEPWGSNADSLARARGVLADTTALQLQYLYGYGAPNPWPDAGTAPSFTGLDDRVLNVIQASGGSAGICLGGAPDWMLDATPVDSNLSHRYPASADHVTDFTTLVDDLAQHYGHTLVDAPIGALKDMPQGGAGSWDVDDYVSQVYLPTAKLLSERYPYVQRGGPWLRIEGTGSDAGVSASGSPYTEGFFLAADHDALVKFLETTKGQLDFVIVQRSAVDPNDPIATDGNPANDYSDATLMALTPLFGQTVQKVDAAVKEALGATASLPIFVQSDFSDGTNAFHADYQAAYVASVLKWEAEAGAAAFILTTPQEQVDGSGLVVNKDGSMLRVFSDTKVPDGGYPYPVATVMQAVKARFPAGTLLVPTRSSNPDVEALASRTSLILINKSPSAQSVLLNCAQDAAHALGPYEVLVLDRP